MSTQASETAGIASPALSAKNLALICCPVCGSEFEIAAQTLRCAHCERNFESDNGIAQLFWPAGDQVSSADVTEIVKAFYEENPFPNYDDVESSFTLREKARKGIFAQMLDDNLPLTSKVLEVGCGTGQLSNFLGECSTRTVIGADLCLNSLRLAQEFKQRNQLENVTFYQINLFRPPFRTESFDVVLSNGVLHHTSDPYSGFKSIARLLKKGGVIMVGLYNTYGRLPTDFRRIMIRAFGDKAAVLDSRLRKASLNEGRRRAWLFDQYKHPHESKHTYGEVLEWFKQCGIEYITSVPTCAGSPELQTERLFDEPERQPTRMARFATQLEMLLKGGVDGGLFIMIGRKAAH
jgi:ubiquinone/menaquinone biosynthesis C-methylase UbiE